MRRKKIWFMTGANRGLGRAFVEAALERGDEVTATSRDPESLKDLSKEYGGRVLPLKLDITDRHSVHGAIQQAKDQFGVIDVLVNNAGFGTFGAVEELSEEQLRRQFEVNVFGTFHVTQAVLPTMREQGSGHILQISSVSGVVTFPYQGAYASSKWAVEGLTEVLAQEVRGFGIKVTLVEPGPFTTDLHGDSSSNAEPQPQYEGLRNWMQQMEGTIAKVSGNPRAAGDAILKIVDAPEPPLRVFLGKSGPAFVPAAYEERIRIWKEWEHLSEIEGLGEAFPNQ
jgi:NAD(P)-dependent dehydrogenase (short-subunit alcohol dehydrogenase family)